MIKAEEGHNKGDRRNKEVHGDQHEEDSKRTRTHVEEEQEVESGHDLRHPSVHLRHPSARRHDAPPAPIFRVIDAPPALGRCSDRQEGYCDVARCEVHLRHSAAEALAFGGTVEGAARSWQKGRGRAARWAVRPLCRASPPPRARRALTAVVPVSQPCQRSGKGNVRTRTQHTRDGRCVSCQ